jgi:hypothetical protein
MSCAEQMCGIEMLPTRKHSDEGTRRARALRARVRRGIALVVQGERDVLGDESDRGQGGAAGGAGRGRYRARGIAIPARDMVKVGRG